ncbi:hypothetical protein HDU93_000762 [Gonapodya sp. JEL0774]|nr:hypothetical protein HDU93_000762 [Gonapodya sp. JEL0774]
MTRIGKILENGNPTASATGPTPPPTQQLTSLLAVTSSIVQNLHGKPDTITPSPSEHNKSIGYGSPPNPLEADTEKLLDLDLTAWKEQITEENARHYMELPMLPEPSRRGLDSYLASPAEAFTSKKRKLADDRVDWMMSPYNLTTPTSTTDLDMFTTSHSNMDDVQLFEPFVNPTAHMDPVSMGPSEFHMLDTHLLAVDLVPLPSPSVPIPTPQGQPQASLGRSLPSEKGGSPPISNSIAARSPGSSSIGSFGNADVPTGTPRSLSQMLSLRDNTKYLTQKSREELQSCVDEVELLVQELQSVALSSQGSPPGEMPSPVVETSPQLPDAEIKSTNGDVSKVNGCVDVAVDGTGVFEATSYGLRPSQFSWPEEDGFMADEDRYVSLRVDPLPPTMSIMTRLNPPLLSDEETRFLFEKYLGTASCWCSGGMPAALLLGPNAIKNPLLLNITVAYGFRYMRQRRQAEIFLARAKRVLASVDELSLTTVRALFLMGAYAGDQGKSAWGHAWSVLALYKSLEMGLNHPPPSSKSMPPESLPRLLNPLEYEFRTRISWFLYIGAVDYSFNYDGSFPILSVDDYGHPIPGSPAERVVHQLIADGLCEPVPPSSAQNARQLQQRFPSYGFPERCAMYRILYRVRMYAKSAAGLVRSNDTLESLELALAKWDASLPAFVRASVTSFLPVPSQTDEGVPKPEDIIFHAAHFLKLMHCLARVMLHRPSATVTPEGPSLVWPTPRSQEICYSTALESTILVTRLLLQNPDASRVNTFGFHPVFQCGSVYALCRHELKNASPNAPFLRHVVGPDFVANSPQELLSAAIQRTEEGLAVHLEMLRRMTHCWGAGGNYYTTLRRMGESLT